MSFIHTAASFALGPLLLWQGRQVRQTLLRLPEPPGDRTGTAGSGPSLRLLIAGDSSAAGVGASSQDDALLGQVVAGLAPHVDVRWRLLARTGATTRRTIRALQRAEPEPFDVAVTALGVNDLTAGVGLADWLKQQQALGALLRERFGARHHVVSGLPPVSGFPALPQPLRWYLGAQARRYDRALRSWAEHEPGATFVALDFTKDPALMASDGFHPGPAIYRAWGARVADLILESSAVGASL